MAKLRNIHPGEILKEEFLIPLDISAYRLSKETFIPQTRISEIVKDRLSKETFIPQTRISEIVKGNRRISADTALRLSKFFGNSAKFWLGLQDDYDIEEELIQKKKEINRIKKLGSPTSRPAPQFHRGCTNPRSGLFSRKAQQLHIQPERCAQFDIQISPTKDNLIFFH